MSKVYNLNYMRPALEHVRTQGNRKIINKDIVKELNISETWFTCYANLIEKLYEATAAYVRIKHSPTTTDEQRKEARGKLYPIWKQLLECGESEQLKKELHVCEDDILSIVGYAERFVNSENNLDFKENFVATKVIATERASKFQRDIETLMGIRMEQANVLTDEQRETLVDGQRLISKKKKAIMAKDTATEKMNAFLSIITKSKDENLNKELQAQIDALKETIKSCDERVKSIEADILKVKDGTYVRPTKDSNNSDKKEEIKPEVKPETKSETKAKVKPEKRSEGSKNSANNTKH